MHNTSSATLGLPATSPASPCHLPRLFRCQNCNEKRLAATLTKRALPSIEPAATRPFNLVATRSHTHLRISALLPTSVCSMRDNPREVHDDREEAFDSRLYERSVPAEAAAGQGRYVVPFTMTREEEALGVEMSRSQLTKLMVECAAPSDDLPSSSWTRVKARKKSPGVILWEKRTQRAKSELRKKRWGSFGSDAAFSEIDAPSAHEEYGPIMYSVRSSTTVNAPLDTVLKTLDASVATAHRSFTRIIYGNLVADTSVLFHSSTFGTDYLAASETDSFETLAVRWLVCRCSNPMTSDGDFCLQEYTKRYSIDELSMNGEHFNNNNRNQDDSGDGSHNTTGISEGLHPMGEMPVAYKLFRSMETRYCPEFQESHRLIRCKVPLGGFLLYPTDNSDKTDVVFYMSIAQERPGDRSGSTAPTQTQCSDRQFRALQQVVRQLALQIERLNNAADSYQMSLYLESLRASRWVRNAERSECAICYRRFHQLTRRRHHCRLCGEVICRECSVHKDVDLPTFGPTALRICTSCDRIHSQLRPKTAYVLSEPEETSENPRRRRFGHSARTQEVVSPSEKLTVRQRSTTLDADNTKTAKKTNQKLKLAEQQFMAAMELSHGRKASEQTHSCPKPAASPAIDRRYFANKWSGNRLMSALRSPGVVTAPSTPKTALPPFEVSRSVSDSSASSPRLDSRSHNENQQQSQVDKHYRSAAKSISKSWQRLKGVDITHNDSEDEDKFDSLQPHSDGASSSEHAEPQSHEASSPTSDEAPVIYAVKNGILADNNSANGNQQPRWSLMDASTLEMKARKHNQNRPLTHRNVKKPELYGDILLKLCEEAAAIRSSKFVAVTLFTREDKNQLNEIEVETASVHFLKVKGSLKLMKVAANLRCCEPVLQLEKSVMTRNTWEVVGNSSIHPSGYEFRQLPIVFGPQQARFYAGVPLMNVKKHYCYGAVAVFDAAINPGEDDDPALKSTLQILEKCASEAVTALDERRKENELQSFLKVPLIHQRNSEPTLHLSRELSGGSRRWQAIEPGEQESLDGDSDDEEIEEAQRRLEYELSHGHRRSSAANLNSKSVGKPRLEFPNTGNDSVGKARVEYLRNRMQELVQRAQNTQAQMVENSLTMERHGVPIL